ncbi:MAG: prolyl oligopeptidase family serine peptidase [Candidatus Aminicenantes bacterium]|nr:prolyl oligopeptidase family serine peptidase [Candidatus Aminicenantes bacterium]NIM78317.1 prolyl oligopeptidase family serine peptidase [Candidatus Aminicenantes bacterium]NIN17548.1 prolyl oligopeptidase family serine peptidase [Candidatus Aminicenantes bacterium]NIN41434.1 prolyl oligopeptidase family serine peptidase [Candidatus Aminicenantes bacterium]NIN84200.1 prolyl oligopeptidase family serine peptidase [Candidatus Aminicenantes bacterium]
MMLELKQDESKLEGTQGKILESQPLSADSPYRDQVNIFQIKYLSDGLKIKGYLLLPADIPEGKPKQLPAIIYNRPGIGDSHKINKETLAYLSILPAHNYVVAATQYRGNDGSDGTESYLDKDINDVLHILTLVRSLAYVDSDRTGMLGFSRGAAVTYQLLKQQVDIKAACVMGCATDFLDAYYQLPHYRPFLEAVFHGTPETAREEYTKRSPLYWPEKINVPLLIIQGTDDHHVPIHQVHQLADKLKVLNKVHDLVIYPEGDHTLDKVREDKDNRILEWFKKYL